MRTPTPHPEVLAIDPCVGNERMVLGASRGFKLASNEGAFGILRAAQAAIASAAAQRTSRQRHV